MDNYHVSFIPSIRNADNLLNATFLVYANDDVRRVRTTCYYLPQSATERVHLIAPTTYFGGSAEIETLPPLYERFATPDSEVIESCTESIDKLSALLSENLPNLYQTGP